MGKATFSSPQELYNHLENLSNEYDSVYEKIQTEYKILLENKDNSDTLISEIESFLNSISKSPLKFKKELNSLSKSISGYHKSDFNIDVIKKMEKSYKNINAASNRAIQGLGLFVSFKLFGNVKIEDSDTIIDIIIKYSFRFIPRILAYLLNKIKSFFVKKHEMKKALKIEKDMQFELGKAKKLHNQISQYNNKVQVQLDIILKRYSLLNSYLGCKYSQLEENTQMDLFALINDTKGLINVLGTKIEV